MMMSVKQYVDWFAGETEVFGGNLYQCRFVQHKSHMTWRGWIPGSRVGKQATNRLIYGMAYTYNLQ
jgi:hypothetical protein